MGADQVAGPDPSVEDAARTLVSTEERPSLDAAATPWRRAFASARSQGRSCAADHGPVAPRPDRRSVSGVDEGMMCDSHAPACAKRSGTRDSPSPVWGLRLLGPTPAQS